MTEFTGNISGKSASLGKGFGPGCSSLHSSMAPHGLGADEYEGFVKSEQKPFKTQEGSFLFMFQSGYLVKTTKYAMEQYLEIDEDYHKMWSRLAEIKFEAEE